MNEKPSSGEAIPGAAPQWRSLSLGRMRRLALKELRETMRDRRTVVTLLLMPILVYPLLSLLFHRFLTTGLGGSPTITYRIAIDNDPLREELSYWIRRGQEVRERIAERSGAEPPPLPQVEFEMRPDLVDAIRSGQVDLAIRSSSPNQRPRGEPLQVELIYREGSTLSETVLELMEDRLQAANELALRRRLSDNGLSVATPTDVLRKGIKVAGQTGSGVSLATVIPLILILMTVTGAVYPAIDLTAGERERGTLEALVAAPVPRLGLLLAKYVAVMLVAVLTATVNLTAMTVTIYANGLGTALFGDDAMRPLVVLQAFGLLTLFAAFFAAVLLAITSVARSFKEAQAYLIPVMLVSLAPGLFSLMPGLQMTGMLAVTPLINIVLLGRDLLQGQVDPLLGPVAVISTLVYTAAAIGIAARVFGADALLYGSEATWRDLIKRPHESQPYPRVSTAMLSLAVLFPLSFLAGSGIGQLSALSLDARLAMLGILTGLLFGGVPLVAASRNRIRWRTAFRVGWPGWLVFIPALLLGLSLWPFAHEIVLLATKVGIGSLSDERMAQAEELVNALRQVSPFLVLAALALSPALFEEWFFRGFLFSALRTSIKPLATVVVSALLFGVFHVITANTFAIERLLPSTFLGLVLGWVCYRTGSIWPGVLLHACHNGLVLMVAYYRDELMARGWGTSEQTHLPPLWLAAAGGAVAVGLLLLWGATRAKVGQK